MRHLSHRRHVRIGIPAASLVHEAKRWGAFTAEINLEPTPASDLVDLSLRGPAEEILVEIEAAREAIYPPAQP
jgi:NAD-dependent SIR2 family protein deacetylase